MKWTTKLDSYAQSGSEMSHVISLQAAYCWEMFHIISLQAAYCWEMSHARGRVCPLSMKYDLS